MNQSNDPFEQMLRRHRPRSVSDEKRNELGRRIRTARFQRPAAVVAFVGAASIVLGLLYSLSLFQSETDPPDQISEPIESNRNESDDIQIADRRDDRDPMQPTLWAYRQAADDSLESFDALLLLHAQTIMPPENESVSTLRQWTP